ncbi:hypothetical protein [Knoellia subterranea]|uniref:DUF2510 domain-containing protein n=1 Tax=Knoellia subterranea KCTC 19937 TaxID=1385521 RepID=A0A0A0JMY6_9MICO|nr:hypothetical protein [Knoellia subterranea]KGN36976.1 hypothetical protein N803_16300 [Knoellia subterranea KCTC 19937]
MNYDRPQWVYVGNGTFRYWDGDIWTDEYREGDEHLKEPPPEWDGAKHAADRHGAHERRGPSLVWIAVALLALVGVVAVALLLG